MATRSNVVIKSGKKKWMFYHHYDGYPEGVGNDLKTLLSGMKDGMDAYKILDALNSGLKGGLGEDEDDKTDHGYELAKRIAGDAEYIYTIDTDKGTLSYKHYNYEKEKYDRPVKMYQGKPSTENSRIKDTSISNTPSSSNGSTKAKGNSKG